MTLAAYHRNILNIAWQQALAGSRSISIHDDGEVAISVDQNSQIIVELIGERVKAESATWLAACRERAAAEPDVNEQAAGGYFRITFTPRKR